MDFPSKLDARVGTAWATAVRGGATGAGDGMGRVRPSVTETGEELGATTIRWGRWHPVDCHIADRILYRRAKEAINRYLESPKPRDETVRLNNCLKTGITN
jgi:hypothetical protein